MTTAFASPIDAGAFGEYRRRGAGAGFTSRLAAGGPFPPEPGRYHLYAGWFCPWSHRATIQLALGDLPVSVSYVDGLRDARGWAFRERTGPDPINGFTLLREAYSASRAGYDGPISVPVLWDRERAQIVTNDPNTLDIDLAVAFGGAATYPDALASRIDDANAWLAHAVVPIMGAAVLDRRRARTLLAAFAELDARLADSRYLLGETLTLADIRLWVTLVRYDAGPNAHGAIGPRLPEFPSLWSYARRLYSLPAFSSTTNFAAFTAPFATGLEWTVSPAAEARRRP